MERLLTDLAARTGELLIENRRHVLAVAHALETHKTISGEDVIAVIEGGRGPMVDGADYVTVEDSLEVYHAQAMAAHQGRENVMTLPALREAAVASDLDEDASGAAMRADPKPS